MHSLIGPVASILEETGCSLEEAIEAATGGKRQPPAPYMSSGTLGLDAFDGTTTAGRARLESDLMRPTGYTDLKSGAKLLPADKGAFTFNFPGEAPIATNGTKQGRKNIGTVMDKIESLCGKMRPQQASSVMTMVSQSALSILKGGLSIYGINADEHSACDFTLSKNAGTGDVTIRYSSHEGLPFKFEWTATVRPDGYVTTTPFKFTDEKALAAAALESKEQLGSLPLSGNAAKEIGRRLLPGSGLAIFKDPGRELKTRMNNIATASVQTYATKAIAGMRKGANGGDIDLDGYVSEFREDLARHAPIRIGDGPLLDTLGAEKARDAYVDFITDGKVKTYAEADRNTRIKASVLMAFSTQGMLSSGMKSVGNAFDANGNDSRLTASMITGTKARKDLVNLSKDEKGNIVVKVGIEFTSGFLILRDEKQRQTLFSTNEGSSIKYDFNVVVTDESLERFAGADWANFDSDANKKIEKDVSVPHSIEKAAEALPGDFKLDLEVDVSFSVNADALAEV